MPACSSTLDGVGCRNSIFLYFLYAYLPLTANSPSVHLPTTRRCVAWSPVVGARGQIRIGFRGDDQGL